VSVVAVALPMCAGAALAATIIVNQRTSEETLSFSDTSTFSDAAVAGHSAFSISGNTGDTLSLGFTVPHGSTGFSATASSDFSVSSPVFTAGVPNDTQAFTVVALNTPSAGTLTVLDNLAVNVAPAGADVTLQTGTAGGYHFLDGTYDPTAGQTSGHPFVYSLLIPGNYSTVGTSTGDHKLLSINAAWNISQNFVFDGTNTVFTASIDNYNPAADRIGLEYQIYGSPVVPLPATVWLLASGVAGLGALVRRRRQPVG
jgi:hypothetical protein